MGSIRIISGALRGRVVRTPAGVRTRPLLTRLRKSLADILRPRLAGARVLDMFGGSGAIGFELLSNGAAGLTVIELDQATSHLIAQNAVDLGVGEAVTVLHGDGLAVARNIAAAGAVFDIVIVAPPYGQGLQQRALDTVMSICLAAPGALVVSQRDAREPVAVAPEPVCLTETRVYGRTAFDFYQ
ncbi:MAG: methyltransferase [Deltaproteobacteria bacterium]|nr:methyltransferase [Deltaproteobacteria bacterium]